VRKLLLTATTLACLATPALAAPKDVVVAVNEDGAFFCQDPGALGIAGNDAEKQRLGEVNHMTVMLSSGCVQLARNTPMILLALRTDDVAIATFTNITGYMLKDDVRDGHGYPMTKSTLHRECHMVETAHIGSESCDWLFGAR
jgi:hypothetical protein